MLAISEWQKWIGAGVLISLTMSVQICSSQTIFNDDLSKKTNVRCQYLPSEKRRLIGTIELDEMVPAIPRKFTPGRKCPEFKDSEKTIIWCRIPNWIAGSWKSIDDKEPGVTFSKGTARDSTGAVWHCVSIPFLSVVNYKDFTIRRIAVSFEQSASPEYRSKICYIAVKVDHNNVILNAAQEEVLATYIPKADDLLEAVHTGKRFNEFGQRMGDINSKMDYYRIKKFPSESKLDKITEKRFRNYLRANGMRYLEPLQNTP